MNMAVFAPLAVILLAVTTLVLLTSPDWRLSIGMLALQYVGVFILVAIAWPLAMAVTKVVTGWIAGAVLGMSISGLSIETQPRAQETSHASDEVETQPITRKSTRPGAFGRFFAGTSSASRLSGGMVRFFSAAMLGLAVISISPAATGWISGLTVEQALGGLLLIGMGLLQLGFAPAVLQTILGLLTTIAGFEIFYAAVETSTLVAGLLSMTNLGLALVGAYLLVAPQMEKDE
jgi:hypothetical protein